MKINVAIKGLNKLQRIAEKYPAISEKYINTAISRSLVRIFGAEKQEAPFGVSGMLRDNWTITNGRFYGTLVSNAPYAVFVHEGTRPHMPPVSAIIPWAKKKGLNPWAVAMSIKKKGTKANPFLKRAISDVRSGIEDEFSNAIESVFKELDRESDDII